jgi:hypothetical protein
LQVQTGQGGNLVFALDDFDRQLRRWRAIYDAGARQQQAIAWVDLAVSHNTPIRFLDANAVAPVTPKPKPASKGKRNV